MERTWVIKPKSSTEAVRELAAKLRIDPILVNLLMQRGIYTYEDAMAFFNPSMEDLHDPFLMLNMDKAIDRIEKAVQNKENILVYGDYDVDGTTAVAMVYAFFKRIHTNIAYYVPDRYLEGYGISFKGIDYAANNGYSLVIALDCGIKAVEKIEYANAKGVDFIICDHHLPGDTAPQAVAVLDPKQPGCKYPFKELSGCGVGFKLIHGYSIKNNIPFAEIEKFIDLVTVSIASDIVPIIGENRIISFFGLTRLKNNPSTGLWAIKKISGIENGDININDIVFKIGPRINAAGRIETGSKAVDLLIAENPAEALNMAEEINNCNDTRKNLDQTIFNEALDMIAKNEEDKNKKTTVLFNPNWHKGVIGIVASRLIDYHYRPTIILTQSNGLINGSARTVEGFDLYRAIDACSHLLETYGGHMFAAGLSLKPENLQKFIQLFESFVTQTISESQLVPRIDIDDVIRLDTIKKEFFEDLQKFQPFGPGNMSPIFATMDVSDSGYGKTVGKNNEHLKLDLKQDSCPGTIIPSIAFQMGNKAEDTATNRTFDVCYSIEKNEYMGKTTIQLRIRDIRIKSY